jgi:hypothetical protein
MYLTTLYKEVTPMTTIEIKSSWGIWHCMAYSMLQPDSLFEAIR